MKSTRLCWRDLPFPAWLTPACSRLSPGLKHSGGGGHLQTVSTSLVNYKEITSILVLHNMTCMITVVMGKHDPTMLCNNHIECWWIGVSPKTCRASWLLPPSHWSGNLQQSWCVDQSRMLMFAGLTNQATHHKSAFPRWSLLVPLTPSTIIPIMYLNVYCTTSVQ